jgi:hypothetical protein
MSSSSDDQSINGRGGIRLLFPTVTVGMYSSNPTVLFEASTRGGRSVVPGENAGSIVVDTLYSQYQIFRQDLSRRLN